MRKVVSGGQPDDRVTGKQRLGVGLRSELDDVADLNGGIALRWDALGAAHDGDLASGDQHATGVRGRLRPRRRRQRERDAQKQGRQGNPHGF